MIVRTMFLIVSAVRSQAAGIEPGRQILVCIRRWRSQDWNEKLTVPVTKQSTKEVSNFGLIVRRMFLIGAAVRPQATGIEPWRQIIIRICRWRCQDWKEENTASLTKRSSKGVSSFGWIVRTMLSMDWSHRLQTAGVEPGSDASGAAVKATMPRHFNNHVCTCKIYCDWIVGRKTTAKSLTRKHFNVEGWKSVIFVIFICWTEHSGKTTDKRAFQRWRV